ncbi:hypothetical protein [uncultured Aquimarina sp.]|uniref:hypothetical protein n=1 Tax=uncultured Aquimarina sp. TaxID=575652 RepID=UPI002605B465|nr:hypothetical protein [uncultured Aquimarina sp.]
MKTLIRSILLISLVINLVGCCTNREPESKKRFYLTLSLNSDSPYNNEVQTIFIESPDDNSGDVFVIGTRIEADKNESDTGYSNVKLDNITLRRLSGKNYGIVSIDENIDGNSTYKHIIRITIDKIKDIPENDEVTYEKPVIIPNLNLNDQIEITVNNLHKPTIGPKICQNQISS